MKHLTIFASAVLVLCVLASTVSAQEYTSIKELKEKSADDWRDYQIQGEYTITDGEDGVSSGVQIIADGGGKFTMVAYWEGLPGDGWGGTRVIAKGELKDGKIAFKPEYMEELEEFGKRIPLEDYMEDEVAVFNVADKTMTPVNSSEAIPLKPVSRTSPTLGEKAPEGATVFYCGLSKDSIATDMLVGEMTVNPETNGVFSEFKTKDLELYRPFKLHVEFMLSFMPNARGQARSNSGVYLYEAHECQVLDSFGLRGENNECGGFYQVARPKVNMCYPPLVWQTYDFDYTPAKYDADGNKTSNARATVYHNGVLIHEDQEFQKGTFAGRGEGAGPRGIYFQGHGNKVQYRNIWMQYK